MCFIEMERIMATPQYPIDLIAIRDAKLKLARCVVKWWNVNYIMTDLDAQEEAIPTEEVVEEEDPSIAAANEIFERLERERLADEAVKQAEIDAAFAAQNNPDAYNASTGSYSGSYGQGLLNDSEQDQVSHILSQRHDAITDLIKGLQDEEEVG